MKKLLLLMLTIIFTGCSGTEYWQPKGNSAQKIYDADLNYTWDSALKLLERNGQKIEAVDKEKFTMELTDGKGHITSNKMKMILSFQELPPTASEGKRTKVKNEIYVMIGTRGFNGEKFDKFLEHLQDMINYRRFGDKNEQYSF